MSRCCLGVRVPYLHGSLSPSASNADSSDFRDINKCVAQSGWRRWMSFQAVFGNFESRETCGKMESSTTMSSGQYLVAPGDIRAESKSLAAPLADEVQIAVRATTLCGSDIHYYQHGRNGTIQVREPLCLGHEAAGEVVAVGADVDLKIGDRVAVECGVPCEACEWCLAQRYNLCPKMRFRSSGSAWPHFQGTLQTRINHPARWTHRYVMFGSALLLSLTCD